MARFHKISFLFLVLIGLLSNSSGEQLSTAKKILNEMGNLPGIVGTAFKMYESFGNVYGAFTTDEGPSTDDRLDEFNEKLENLSSDLKSFEDRLNDKLEHSKHETDLEKHLNDLSAPIKKIDYYFQKFVNYANESLKLFDTDMPTLVEKIFKDDPIDIQLEAMHVAFRGKTGISNIVPELLRIPSVAQDYMCILRQTPQQFISIIYERILLTEVKASAMLMYAHAYMREIYNLTESSHDDISNNDLKVRMNNTYTVMKTHTAAMSRELWKCDESRRQMEGIQYARIGPVFQKFVMNEVGAIDEVNGKSDTCAGDCEDFKFVKSDNRALHNFKHCHGNVRNCETHRGGPNMTFCLSQDGYRRYAWIKYGNEVLGQEDGCAHPSGLFWDDTYLPRFMVRCYYCLCTCESDKAAMDRYFSLRPVKSDYENNKVIVSAQLQLRRNMFYIQIRQGKLLPTGRVQPDDEWSLINYHGLEPENSYKVTWDNKKVLLDDLYISSNTSEENRVMTGLRFEQVDNQLRLGVFLSKFNYTTGKLGDTIYHVNDRRADHRSLISLAKSDVPNKYKNNKQLSGENEYIEFTTSNDKKDAGQTVLPFVDIQKVESYPFSPLSGAGLFLRGDERKESGGYLALKLFTLDTAPYLKEPKLGEKVPVAHK